MFGKKSIEVSSLELFIPFIKEMDQKLDTIIHDLQQIKTSQRASQKRERKTLKEAK